MTTQNYLERKTYPSYHFEAVDNGPFSEVSAYTAYDHELSSSFSGVENPSWWQQVRYGANATTIASGIKESVISTPWFASADYQAPTQLIRRQVTGSPNTLFLQPPPDGSDAPGLSASVGNAVLVRFLKRALSEQRSLQGGVFLGEIRQTIRLIRNPLKALENAIYEYVHACRGRSRYLSPRQIPRMIAEEYLAFTFGVQPLLSDIKGAYKAYIRLRDLPQLVRVRAFAQAEVQVSRTSSREKVFDIPFVMERERIVRCSAKIVGAVKIASVSPGPPLREATGFMLRDFVPTIYNLIPYSFLLDYFVNVNDILDCMSFNQADLAWYSRSVRTSGETHVSCFPARPNTIFGLPCVGYSFNPCKASWTNVTFSRDAQPLGLPSLVFKLPNLGQSVNIAALASLRVL